MTDDSILSTATVWVVRGVAASSAHIRDDRDRRLIRELCDSHEALRVRLVEAIDVLRDCADTLLMFVSPAVHRPSAGEQRCVHDGQRWPCEAEGARIDAERIRAFVGDDQ